MCWTTYSSARIPLCRMVKLCQICAGLYAAESQAFMPVVLEAMHGPKVLY